MLKISIVYFFFLRGCGEGREKGRDCRTGTSKLLESQSTTLAVMCYTYTVYYKDGTVSDVRCR